MLLATSMYGAEACDGPFSIASQIKKTNTQTKRERDLQICVLQQVHTPRERSVHYGCTTPDCTQKLVPQLCNYMQLITEVPQNSRLIRLVIAGLLALDSQQSPLFMIKQTCVHCIQTMFRSVPLLESFYHN